MKRPLLWTILGLVALALALGAIAVWLAWPFKIGVHGYIAYALGCVLTAGLTIVLMRLAFFSDSKGFDDIDREE